MDNSTASVIIPTRNRPQVVANCLDAMAAQTMPSGSFEVIVVDNGSEPALA
jgi:glycosyltransferase involved in cell wall biosynthesis